MLLNYERALEKMRANDLDALIASSCENVHYCADLETGTTYRYKYGRVQAHCVLLSDDILKPVLIIPVDLLAHLALKPSWVEDIRTHGVFYIYGRDQEKLSGPGSQYNFYMDNCRNYPTANEALLDVLKEKGLERAKIGFDENNLPPNTWEYITSLLPHAQIMKAAGIFKEIRMVKTLEEIQWMKESTQINDEASRQVIEIIREGVTEAELLRRYRSLITERNAFFGVYSTGGGPMGGGLFPVPPSNHVLRAGDSIRYDVSCIFNGYWSDTGRTIFLGEPSKTQLKYFNALFSGLRAAESVIRVDAKVSLIFEAAVKTIRENGIPEYQRHHIGHSMGLETYEPPMIRASDRPIDSDIYLSEEGEMKLEEDMVVNIECPYYDLQMGGFQFEETYIVKKDGYIRISSLNRRPYIIEV